MILRGPITAIGDCIDGVQHGSRIWSDPTAPIYSGDLVSIILYDDEGLHSVGKRLQLTRDGRVWACCKYGVLPLELLPIVAIEKVVRIEPPSALSQPFTDDDPPTAADLALMKKLSKPARDEWARLGYPQRTRLEFDHGH